MPSTDAPPRVPPSQFWPAWLVLVAGLALTGWQTRALVREADRHDGERFTNEVTRLVREANGALGGVTRTLQRMGDRISVDDDFTGNEWSNLLDELDPEVSHPGVFAFAFAERLFFPHTEGWRRAVAQDPTVATQYRGGDFAAHEAKMRRHLANYTVHGGSGPVREFQFPVTERWVTTEVRTNAPVWLIQGFDLAREREFDRAIRWTVGTKGPGATGLLTVKFGAEERPVFAIANAVFWSSMPGNVWPDAPPGGFTPEQENRIRAERLAAHERGCKGVLFAALDARTLLRRAVRPHADLVGLRLYAGTNATTEGHFFTWPETAEPEGDARWRSATTFPFYARKLHAEFFTRPAFAVVSTRRNARWFAAAGGGISLALATLVAVQVRARRLAEAHARELAEARDQLRAAVESREATRRDLHDGVLQSLYALTLSLGRARRVMQRDALEAEALLTQQTAALDEVMAAVRGHLGGERRGETAGNLAESLRAVADAVGCDGECAVKLDVPAELAATLPEKVAANLLNIVREAVSNARRHGRAREIAVSLKAGGGKWRLEVADNGAGFDPQAAPAAGHGLRNIDARVAELSGSCRVESRPGGPTRVVVEVEQPAQGA